MQLLKKLLKRKTLILSINKHQKELLEIFILNKADFEAWVVLHPLQKIRFQFYYPTAIDFYYSDFKLFTAYFKKTGFDNIELTEVKISEANFDSIRCYSWNPFEEVIIDFLTSLEESKKIALFEKRKLLFEYESLCTQKTGEQEDSKEYLGALSSLLAR